MIRVLVLIAVTGFFVGVVSLASAAAIGGPDLASNGWLWANKWKDVDWDHIDFDDPEGNMVIDETGAPSTREIAWTGGSELDIDLPADVRYVQAPGPGKVTITGSQRAVAMVTLNNGRLELEGDGQVRRRLKVVVTAPGVTRFDISGGSELSIEGYKQDILDLDASGSTEVTATGVARSLKVDVSGSADVDLSRLDVQSAVVASSGSAETSLAPKAAAELDISGGSEVTLLTKPTQLQSDISGAGELHQSN